MTDHNLGPIEEDVPFAWGEASSLKHSFIRAARELRQQSKRITKYGDDALEEWRGRYAKEFEGEHMAITTGDADKIADECERCAEMLSQLANLAREEDDRRKVARAWKAEHDKWEEDQKNRGFGGWLEDTITGDDEPKPPDLPEIKPQPLVAKSPPVEGRG